MARAPKRKAKGSSNRRGYVRGFAVDAAMHVEAPPRNRNGRHESYVEPDVQGLAEGRGWTRPAPVDWRDEVRGTGPTPEALAALRRQQERRRNGL